MTTFFKRNTLIRNISLMAIMAAINVIFSVLNNFIPLVSAFLIIFLPLTSSIVEINCKDRYFPIYAFATIGLSIVVSLSSIDFTLFYVVPSLITGYLFGLAQKKNIAPIISVFVASIVQTGLSIAFIPLLNLISERNLLDDIETLFKFGSHEVFQNYIFLIFFIVAVAQTFLSYFVVSNEIKRLGYKIETKNNYELFSIITVLVSSVLSIGFAFIYTPISLICWGFAWFFEVYLIILAIKNKAKIKLISLGVIVLFNLFFNAGLGTLVGFDCFHLLILFTPVITSIVLIFVNFLNNKRTHNKI